MRLAARLTGWKIDIVGERIGGEEPQTATDQTRTETDEKEPVEEQPSGDKEESKENK